MALGGVGQVILADDSGADRVLHVVVEIGEGIGQLDHLAFQRFGNAPGLGEDVLAGLAGLAHTV